MAPNVLIRADASNVIGSGHVMRCLTLAEGLRARGAAVAFVSRDLEGHLNALIAGRGFAVHVLPRDPACPSGMPATCARDARECAALVTGHVDWIITDHYGLDFRWHDAMRPVAGRIMAIDDLANRRHECDLLLDQNLSDGPADRYAGLVPSRCARLLGPRFALLQPEYAPLHEQCAPRFGRVGRILVFFGGADRDGLSARALDAILGLRRPELAVDVVVGVASPDLESIRRTASAYDQIRVHSVLPSLAPLIAKADLGIGAGGSTTWERLCLGLPSIVVTVAENQVQTARLLTGRGLVDWVGDARTISASRLAEAVSRHCETGVPPGWFPDYPDLVDGRGVSRVCDALLQSVERSQ
jgi:UDP-2,4-diacetamido-2,4,6-trideoxy-beta-L-altropyranose hydrolase